MSDDNCVPPAATAIYTSNPFTKELKFNSAVVFTVCDGREVLKLEANGDFYVQGRLVVTDLEVYESFKSWLGEFII